MVHLLVAAAEGVLLQLLRLVRIARRLRMSGSGSGVTSPTHCLIILLLMILVTCSDKNKWKKLRLVEFAKVCIAKHVGEFFIITGWVNTYLAGVSGVGSLWQLPVLWS